MECSASHESVLHFTVMIDVIIAWPDPYSKGNKLL